MDPKSCTTTELGMGAARRCIHQWGGDRSKIGLLIAGTDTPDHMFPCLASEVLHGCQGLFSRHISTVSMESKGNSNLEKAIEVAGWYLDANPEKFAIVLMAESRAPDVAPPLGKQYSDLRNTFRFGNDNKLDLAQLVNQPMPFSHGAVALLIGGRSANLVNYAFAEYFEGRGLQTYDTFESAHYLASSLPSPPNLAEKLLLLFLSRNDRANLIGDLAEEFTEIELKHGSRFADLWYWKQTLASVFPLTKKALRWSLFAWLGNFIRRHVW